MPTDDPRLDYIERPEFEQRFKELNIKVDRGFDGLNSALARVVQKLEERDAERRPRLGTLIGAFGGIGIPALAAFFAIALNMADTKTLAASLATHLAFSERKADEFTAGITALRAQQSRNITMLDEQEMQHRWIADVMNTTHDYEARMASAYCVKCDAEGVRSRIHLDPRGYSPLVHIGQVKVGD